MYLFLKTETQGRGRCSNSLSYVRVVLELLVFMRRSQPINAYVFKSILYFIINIILLVHVSSTVVAIVR